jgi:hypothetical protein
MLGKGMVSQMPAKKLSAMLALALLLACCGGLAKAQGEDQPSIRKVTFIGSIDGKTDIALRKASKSIGEGLPYSPKSLDKAIQAINELGAFHRINRTHCAVTQSKENGRFVDITIRLRAKSPPSGE